MSSRNKRSIGRRATAPLVLTVAVALAGGAIARAPLASDDGGRLDGEYGLTVRENGDTVTVGWITARPVPGALEVLVNGRVRTTVQTPADSAHRASFRRPGGRFTLRYGAAGDAPDRHETRIDLDRLKDRDGTRFSGVDSIFVISDIHGEFDTLAAVLRNANVVGSDLKWRAGHAHLVVAGDMLDRGADATRVLWFLYGLEGQARAAGGRVHVMLGNHEVMVMTNDLRYTSPKELRIARLHGVTYDRLFDNRHTVLGRWLSTKPAIIRIDDLLFTHGGVTTDYLPYSLSEYDDSLARFMSEDLFYLWGDTTATIKVDSAAFVHRDAFFWGERSALWFRGYATTDSLAPALDSVLDHFDARVHVIGHTPGPHVRVRYGGAVIAVNTLPFGSELLLLVKEGKRHRGWRVPAHGPPVALDSLAG